MMTPTECHLQAENYRVAASMADDDTRMTMLEQAAMWRRRAFELQMLRFEHLREQPEERSGEAGPDSRGITD